MSAQLHHVSIFVRDLERSLKLFRDLLGLQEVQTLKNVGGKPLARLIGIADFAADMVFLKHPDQGILLELVRQTGGETPEHSLPAAGGFGLSFLVRDLDETHASLSREGWPPFSPPMEMPDPTGRPIRLFCFRTDEGLTIELMSQAREK